MSTSIIFFNSNSKTRYSAFSANMEIIPDQRLRRQFKSKDCMDKAVKNRELLYDNVPARYSKVCANKTSRDGWDINEYAPDELFTLEDTDGKKWCFRLSDIPGLLAANRNPHTGNPFTLEQLRKLNDLEPPPYSETIHSIPLTEQLRDIDLTERCPLWRSEDPLVRYAYVCPWEEKDIYRDLYQYRAKSSASMAHEICIGRLYKITLKEPYEGNLRAAPEKIAKVEVLKEGSTMESAPRPLPSEQVILPPKNYPAIYGYTFAEDFNLPALEKFYNLGLRPKAPITLYRGFHFSGDEIDNFIKGFKKDKISVGDILEYAGRKPADSWTTNVCLATAFAMAKGAGYDDGIVIKYTAQPEEIILDTRYVKNMSDFYKEDQAEVILTNYPIKVTKGKGGRKRITVGKNPILRKVEASVITRYDNQWVKTRKATSNP